MKTAAPPPSRWFEVLEDYYDVKLTPEKRERWVQEIKAKIPSVSGNEPLIVDALRSQAASFKRRSTKTRPDLEDLIQIIRAHRNEPSATGMISTTNEVTPTPKVYAEDGSYRGFGPVSRTTMSDLKFMLDRRPPPDAAWGIICTPMMVEQCRELEAYCRQRNIAFNKFNPPQESRVAAIARKFDRNPNPVQNQPDTASLPPDPGDIIPDYALIEPPPDADMDDEPSGHDWP